MTAIVRERHTGTTRIAGLRTGDAHIGEDDRTDSGPYEDGTRVLGHGGMA